MKKDESNLSDVFSELKLIMQNLSKNLVCITDLSGDYVLNARHMMKNKKQLFFGRVNINKSSVSFHLMPVYVNPEILNSISGQLKKRLHGSSCFNFNQIDKALFSELKELSNSGYDFYLKEGYIFDPEK